MSTQQTSTTVEIVTEIEKPKTADDIRLLKKMGCMEVKNSRILVLPEKLKAVKTKIFVPNGGCMGCNYYSTKYEVSNKNKKNKLVCTILRCEDGDGSFQEIVFY